MIRRDFIERLCCCAVLAMVLTACSNEDEPETTVTQGVPMVLEAAVGSEIETRASKDGTWASSNNVTVYAGSAKNYRTPSPSNTATATISGINLSNTHHWTSSTETKDVKAWFYGDNVYRTSCTGTWTIPATQDANTVQNYDFLYASKKISYGDASKALDFYHQLARVTVTVKFLNNSLTTVTGVKLGNDNVWPSGTFNQPTISTTSSTYGTWTKSGTGVTIQMYGSGNSTTGTYTALLIPQEFAANDTLFTIETNDGNSVYAPTSKTTFAAGSHYTYELTVQNGLVSVQTATKIADWAANPSNGSSSADPKVGDVYYSDGTWSTSLNTSKTPIGIIVYVATTANDPVTENKRCLVMALQKVGPYKWADTTGDETYGGLFPNIWAGGNSTERMNIAKGDFQGLAKTTYLAGLGATARPAAYYAYNYSVTRPSSATRWFLPSAGQWIATICSPGLGGFDKSSLVTYGTYHDPNKTIHTNINAALAKAGNNNTSNYTALTTTGINYYWTSSDDCSQDYVCICFGASGVRLTYSSGSNIVRPFLCF